LSPDSESGSSTAGGTVSGGSLIGVAGPSIDHVTQRCLERTLSTVRRKTRDVFSASNETSDKNQADNECVVSISPSS